METFFPSLQTFHFNCRNELYPPCCLNGSLNRRCFAILTPNTSQRVADLSHGRISLDAFENSRQKIFIRPCSLLKLLQRGADSFRITSLAPRSHPFTPR